MDNQLLALRQQINKLDLQLLDIIAQRNTLSLTVAQTKQSKHLPIRDEQREKELINKLVTAGVERNLDTHYVTQLFQLIIEESVLTQQAALQNFLNQQPQGSVRMAFLGPKGSYSYLAARSYASRHFAQMLECSGNTFKELLQWVEKGEVDYAVLPIENTSSGSITEVYDLLQHTQLSIVGELFIPVDHCLLTAGQCEQQQIKQLYSHPQPIEQCSHYLEQFPHWEIHYCKSTAIAMKKVAALNCNSAAALGSAEGGELYGLQTLTRNMANQRVNSTRFIILARNPIEITEQVPTKTTLILATGQQSGALVDALMVFRTHDIVMTKLESRPIHGNPWEEMFYIDLQINLRNHLMQRALQDLLPLARFVKILGCYPSEHVIPVTP